MNYTIIGLKSQLHILGNFLYINDNIHLTPFSEKFNIYFLEDFLDLPNINTNEHKVTTLFPNEKYYFSNSIKEIFDFFNLPYLFIGDDLIENYYN